MQTGCGDIQDAKDAANLIDSRLCLMSVSKKPWHLTNFSGVNFQNIDVFGASRIGVRHAYRTRRHILADPARDFLFSIPLQESILVKQAGKQSLCVPGTFRILSTSTPFFSHASGTHARDRFSHISGKISGSMLRPLLPDIDNYPDLVLKIRAGSGKIMKSLIEAGLAEGNALSVAQARDFGKLIIQAIANAILDAPEQEMRPAKVNQSSHAYIRESARDFIARNLSNPYLDCALVAAHCQVSETYLHVSFAAAAIKVGAYIREARLQQCRRDLQNPVLRHHTITEIMMNWGYVDPTSFGRAYKARFGLTPREERNALISSCKA